MKGVYLSLLLGLNVFVTGQNVLISCQEDKKAHQYIPIDYDFVYFDPHGRRVGCPSGLDTRLCSVINPNDTSTLKK
ncbi:MAG: hypothetical protein LBR36_00035 [Bacteroidales bacterium]|jgi:hypothetical protein|nr:hypothetical protein [Bacteroidales bacterium]